MRFVELMIPIGHYSCYSQDICRFATSQLIMIWQAKPSAVQTLTSSTTMLQRYQKVPLAELGAQICWRTTRGLLHEGHEMFWLQVLFAEEEGGCSNVQLWLVKSGYQRNNCGDRCLYVLTHYYRASFLKMWVEVNTGQARCDIQYDMFYMRNATLFLSKSDKHGFRTSSAKVLVYKPALHCSLAINKCLFHPKPSQLYRQHWLTMNILRTRLNLGHNIRYVAMTQVGN